MITGIRISALTSLTQVTTTDVMPINSTADGRQFTYQAQVGQIAPVRSVNGQTGHVAFPLTAAQVSYLNAAATTNSSSLQVWLNSQPIYVQTWMTSADGTDVKPAIQRIKDAGLLGSGAHVVLPRGNYTAGSGLNGGRYLFEFVSCSGVVVEGAGPDITVITAAASTNLGFAACRSLSNARFSNLTFNADRSNQALTPSGVHGIRGDTMTNVLIEDVHLKNALGYAFGAQAGTFTNVRFKRCKFENPGADGIDFKNPNSNNSGCVIDEVEVINWGRRDPSIPKAAFDIRGPAVVQNCIARWIDVSSTTIATNHVAFRSRPDASDGIVYTSISPAVPEEGELVFSTSSGGATGTVRGVSGSSSLTRGAVALEDVEGTFVPGAQVSIGANSATIFSYATSADNGGGSTIFLNCYTYGPTTTAIGVGFALLDTNTRVIGGIVRNAKVGITVQVGGVESEIYAVEISDVSVGIDVICSQTKIYGGSIRRASEAGVDIIGVPDVVVDGMTFTSCARGVRRSGASYNARISNLSYVGTSARTVNFDWGDQASVSPRAASRSGAIFSLIPTTSYQVSVTLSGGVGGAANSPIYFYPLPLFNEVTNPQFLGTVIGTAAAGRSAKVGLYRDLGNTPAGAPLLIAPTSTLDMSSAANTQQRVAVSTATTLEPGLYWLAYMADGNTTPYTVPVSGNVGEWARYVGINNANSLFDGTGGQTRVASVSLFDYGVGLPTTCPEVTFATSAPGSPFLFLQG